MVGSGSRRLAWLVGVLAGALLPFAPVGYFAAPAVADPVTFDGKEIRDLCTISDDGQSCPVFPPPPGLLNAGAKAAAGPEVAAALDRLEDQAIATTLSDHQLPAGDRDAVLSWAREDAQVALWGLIAEAIETPAAERTDDQQLAVDWMTMLDSAQPQDAAVQAGAEYTKWAGLNLDQYRYLARDPSTTTQQLTDFLAQDVRTYDPNYQAGFGYCQYVPPSPYSSEDYDGSDSPNCGNFCTSILGCPVPTPTYDQFVSWGQAASLATATDEKVTAQAVNIGLAAGFGAVVVGAGLAAVFSAAIVAAVGASIWSFAMGAAAVTSAAAAAAVAAGGAGTAAGAAASATAAANFVPGIVASGAAAAAVVAAVVVVILAIVISVLEAIRISDNAALPGKLAKLVIDSRDAETDPATLIGTTDGKTTLFYLYVGATLPLPRTDVACDNSLIPPWAYSSSFDPNLLVYVPLGSNQAITSPADRRGCLNAPPIPPATDADAHFLVKPRSAPAGQTGQVSPTISVGGAPVRLHGSWFVVGNGSQSQQTLRLQYTDWDGDTNFAWLFRADTGYQFVGASVDDDDSSIDPDTCQVDGTCWRSDTIEYVGPDGLGYSASIEEPAQATGQPTYSPSNPLEAHPVTFDAGDFEPPSSDHDVDYTWRFQKLGCGWIECVRNDQGVPAPPAYSDPVSGRTATYTWQSIGPAKVELTATDQHGHTATTVFVVDVGNVPPTAVALHEYDATVGQEITVQGTVADAGEDDDLNIEINFGDGVKKQTKVGANSIPLEDPKLTRLRTGTEAEWGILAQHTYTQPGVYYGGLTASDWGGGTATDGFTVRVTGPQQISFPPVPDQVYGGRVAPATGSALSGVPVTYTAGPDTVCRPSAEGGQAVDLVGVGTCTVTASQPASPPTFLAAAPVTRSFDVDPAPLTIKALYAEKTYGAADPAFTASYVGLAAGDSQDDFPGLVLTGPPAGSDVGDHPITPAGATNPNYDITYVPGVLRIKPRDLTVVVLDYSRSYGADNPDFDYALNGLADGDTKDDVPGVILEPGPPVDAPVGEYFVEASGGSNPNYTVYHSKGTVTVTPAPLTVTADDQDRVYGGPAADLTATYEGFVLGDDEDDVTGLVLTGPSAGADAGRYAITPSGASIANYAVSFVAGTATVHPAPLRVRADNATRVYGDAAPAYSASVEGLVNGDGEDEVTGLTFTGAPDGAGVGTYTITPSGVDNPNYDARYEPGTETVTPARLTIRADDVAVASGSEPAYSWHGDGWVGGDSDATFATPPRLAPTCGAAVPTMPGLYRGTVSCAGARDANYAISYAPGDLRVDPVVSLAQRGLPRSAPKRVFVDGAAVTLPLVRRVVRLDTRHAYRFPAVLLVRGRTYVTTTPAFDRPVSTNLDVTATYRTMHRLLRTSDGIGKQQAQQLDRRWDAVERLVEPRRKSKLLAALHGFAHQVRQQTGAGITTAAARDLLTYARLVYQRYGGTGTV